MKNKCDVMMELIFYETYVDSTKLKDSLKENYCFQSTRNS